MRTPLKLLLTGFALLLAGFITLLLMILRVIEPGFFFSFLAYTASTIGLILGLIAIIQLRR
ncbi:MAG: hypothetical protein Q8O55_06345 [Dehalococcoidales bacterium]|nr:hypothetical protein [Dehalococcoidales bacterium]